MESIQETLEDFLFEIQHYDYEEKFTSIINFIKEIFSNFFGFLFQSVYSSPKKVMSLQDKLTLSPWKKWKKYGRFPYKIIVHLLLFLLCTVQALLIFQEFSTYVRISSESFSSAFTSDLIDDDTDAYFNIKDSLQSILFTVTKYFTFVGTSLDRYLYIQCENGTTSLDPLIFTKFEEIIKKNYEDNNFDYINKLTKKNKEKKFNEIEKKYFSYYQTNPNTHYYYYNFESNSFEYRYESEEKKQTTNPLDQYHYEYPICNPEMIVTFYDEDESFFNLTDSMSFGPPSTYDEIYELTPDLPLGPYNVSDYSTLRLLFWKTVKIVIKFKFQNLNVGFLGPIPFEWTINNIWDLSSGGGLARFSIDPDTRIFQSSDVDVMILFSAINGVVFGLSLLSLILEARGLIRSYLFYIKVRDMFNSISRVDLSKYEFNSWESIPMRVKIRFFNPWSVFNILGNGCLVSSGIVSFKSETPLTGDTFLLLFSLGSFSVAINMIRYLEYSEGFYTLILTLRLSFIRILRHILSVFPIFFGYTLAGVALFSEYSTSFRDISASAVTLFCLLNGDNIHSTFDELTETYPWSTIVRLYLFTFITLFITAVLNVFIFIIEDAYHAAKSTSYSFCFPRYEEQNETTIELRKRLDEIYILIEILEEEHKLQDLEDQDSDQDQDKDQDQNQDLNLSNGDPLSEPSLNSETNPVSVPEASITIQVSDYDTPSPSLSPNGSPEALRPSPIPSALSSVATAASMAFFRSSPTDQKKKKKKKFGSIDENLPLLSNDSSSSSPSSSFHNLPKLPVPKIVLTSEDDDLILYGSEKSHSPSRSPSRSPSSRTSLLSSSPSEGFERRRPRRRRSLSFSDENRPNQLSSGSSNIRLSGTPSVSFAGIAGGLSSGFNIPLTGVNIGDEISDQATKLILSIQREFLHELTEKMESTKEKYMRKLTRELNSLYSKNKEKHHQHSHSNQEP